MANLRAGTGWRWNLASTQLYNNQVQVEESGEQLIITADRKGPSWLEVLCYQVSDEDWLQQHQGAITLAGKRWMVTRRMRFTAPLKKSPAKAPTASIPRLFLSEMA